MPTNTTPTTNVGTENVPVKKLIASDDPNTRAPMTNMRTMPTVAGLARRGFSKSLSFNPMCGSIGHLCTDTSPFIITVRYVYTTACTWTRMSSFVHHMTYYV